jgi:hypothetical protein
MTLESIQKSLKEMDQNLTILKVEIDLLAKDNESLLKENMKLKESL